MRVVGQLTEAEAALATTLRTPQTDDWEHIRVLVEEFHIDKGHTLRDTVTEIRQQGYLVT